MSKLSWVGGMALHIGAPLRPWLRADYSLLHCDLNCSAAGWPEHRECEGGADAVAGEVSWLR